MRNKRAFNSRDSNKPAWKGLGVKRPNGKCITIKKEERKEANDNRQ
jgi:hypothetical protein